MISNFKEKSEKFLFRRLLKEYFVLIPVFLWFLYSVWPLPFTLYTDGLRLWIPRLNYAANELIHGHIPFWNEFQFCGAALLADGTTNILNPFIAFYTFLTPQWAYTIEILMLFVVLLLGSWKYFRQIGFSYTASIVGTLGYCFSGQVIFWSMFHGMNLVLALFPWILFFFHKYEKTKLFKWNIAAYTSVFLISLGGFIQFAFLAALSAIIEGMKDFSVKSIKETVKNRAFTVIFGVLSASVIIIPVIEAAISSHRKFIHYFDGLLPKIIPLFMMVFTGNSFGTHSLFHNYFFYFGVIILALAIFAMRKNFKEFISCPFFIYSLIFPAILIIIYLDILPTSFQFGVQSDPYRGMFIFVLTLSILAAKGTDLLFKYLDNSRDNFYVPFEILFAVFVLVVYFLIFSLISFVNSLPVTMYIAMVFIILIGLLAQYRLKNQSPQLRKVVFSLWIISIICFNSFPLAKAYLARSAMHSDYNVIERWKSHGVPTSLLSGEGRILNYGDIYNQFENRVSQYKIRSIGGYGTFFPKWIFIKIRDEGLITKPYVADTFFKNNTIIDSKILARYGVEYLIADLGVGYNFALKGWKLVYPLSNNNNNEHIYKNPEYAGRAYIIDKSGNIIRGASIVKDENTHIQIKIDARKGEEMVLSDSWYPGWVCYDNGKKVKGYNKDGFRGYKFASSGKHQIDWIYQPKSFLYGLIFSIFGIIGFGLLLVTKFVENK